MQIKVDQLAQRLKQNNLPLVWISGDDPLLMQEACDIVRTFARSQGFGERQVLEAGNGFDWNQLLASGLDLSLFAERKLIDLRLHTARVEEEARVALQEYLRNPNPDNLLLLTTAKIDKTAQGTKWFRQLEEQALFCTIWPPNEQQLPQWIRQRLQRVGMDADAEALQLLAEKVEGNLLAAAQEVEKLHILSNTTQLDAATVIQVVADSSRFNVFALTDACLAGNSERALRILSHLQAEGEECLGLTFMVCREIRALSAMLADLERGHNLNGVLQEHRVWSNRTQMVTSALERHTQRSLLALLERARRVDQSVKGLLDFKPWDELAGLVLGLSNPRLLVGVI
ncbi:MAG: DNA polymerase III subunit delta [Pseudohongiellaceae bacterium]